MKDSGRGTAVGPIDEGAMWIRSEADAAVAEAEARLRERGLTLGSQPPSIFAGTVGEWLEGPWAGRRALAGRLEPGVAGVEARLADGTLFRSVSAPRSAAGPALAHLFLGGGGSCGRILAAWLKARRLPAAVQGFSLEGATPAIGRALRHWILHGPQPLEVALEVGVGSASAARLTLDVGTLDRTVAAARMVAEARAFGLRVQREPPGAVGGAPVAGAGGAGAGTGGAEAEAGSARAESSGAGSSGTGSAGARHERELAQAEWPAFVASLPQGARLYLCRLAKESVVVVGGEFVGGRAAAPHPLFERIAAAFRG